MDAVLFEDFGEARIGDVPRPTPEPDEVLISVDVVQLSVTECMRYLGEEIAGIEKIKEILDNGETQLFGHEFSGEVVELGDRVTTFQVGDRVYAPGKISCGECRQCTSGFSHYCPNKTGVGKDRPGALAEYLTMPVSALSRLPDGVTDAEGAALQPLASSILCVYDGNIRFGDTVALFGAGVMGNQCGQLAMEMGASTVYAIDVVDRKLDLARGKGMVPVNATEVDPTAYIEEQTDGIGADVVFEAVGGDQSRQTNGSAPLEQAFRTVRNGGNVVQVGHIVGDFTITPRLQRTKCVNWINPRKGTLAIAPNTDTGDLAAELVDQSKVNIRDYITHQKNGLGSFDEVVDITMNKGKYDALGPAQILV